MRNRTVSGALALVLMAGPAMGQEAPDLSWFAGHWCGESQGRTIDEVWLPEAGGQLLGMARTLHGAKVESFEFLRIVVEGGAASFHAQPNGVPPTVFAMEDRGEGWIRFANEAHDFPNRVEYRREGDRLHAWIAGPGEGGEEVRIPFEYRACGT